MKDCVENDLIKSFAGLDSKQRLKMKWLERFFGPSDHRWYGENEYYEYPCNGVYLQESFSGPPDVPWRGPSIFEVTILAFCGDALS